MSYPLALALTVPVALARGRLPPDIMQQDLEAWACSLYFSHPQEKNIPGLTSWPQGRLRAIQSRAYLAKLPKPRSAVSQPTHKCVR